MYTGIFDTHAHYDDAQFNEDRDALVKRLPSSGISFIVNCGTDVNSSRESIALAEKYPFIYAACGVHCHEASMMSDGDLTLIKAMLRSNKKAVAVGEIGLDYHYDFSPHETQLAVFEKQLELANELGKPVIIHDREAHEDTYRLLRKYHPKGVVHCFSGSPESALEIVKLGMYIGLGGAVTFKNARKPCEVAQAIPLDRLLLETDCPYMTPVPFRGSRCDSSYIPYTAEKIARLRNMDVQLLIDKTAENAKTLFGTE